jgi:hypothetical protein
MTRAISADEIDVRVAEVADTVEQNNALPSSFINRLSPYFAGSHPAIASASAAAGCSVSDGTQL